MYLLMRRRRRAALINLQMCFPELSGAQHSQLLRTNFEESGIGVFEFIRAWWGPEPAPESVASMSGLEHLRSAQQTGRGIILISAHFTTLEMAARLLGQHCEFAGLYRPHDAPALEWAVSKGRGQYTQAMFTRDELRPALKHLKAGGVLWFAPDQESRRGESVFVEFFGNPAWSLTSTHQLARMANAHVLPFFHRRHDDGTYELEIGAAFTEFPSTDETADTARVMAALESMIRRAPHQYLWMHQRFKKQADGSNPYRSA